MKRSNHLVFQELIDIEPLRQKLEKADNTGGCMGRVWQAVKREAKGAPEQFAWFVPFTAVVTGDADLTIAAKKIIEKYLDKAEYGSLGKGVQFHFWCFSFPHARWAIWFELLRQAGAWTEEEAAELAAKFLMIQMRDFHSGMLTKPYPETVDNQAASLTLSSVVLGTLFRDWPGNGLLARALREEALQRCEALIGGFPKSGYSGEGSTYQGRVVAVTVPFLVEFIQYNLGGDWFNKLAAPNGTSAADILGMTARMWMPGGLLLPWDDYGYQLGTKAPLAYMLKKTGDSRYAAALEEAAVWSENGSAGWGYDDLIWALVHWPAELATEKKRWVSWCDNELGGVLVSSGGERYLMQMWDETTHKPLRGDVNPNQLVLAADGVPFIVDGAADKEAGLFEYDDTWLERSGANFQKQSLNYGNGCGGAHSVILLDQWEGLRPAETFAPQFGAGFDPERQTISGDVTGLYKSVYDDVRRVRRRSRMIDDRAWLVEDLISSDKPHTATSRWYFRPAVEVAPNGIDLETVEGMRLQMRALIGPGQGQIERLDGFPKVLDRQSDRVDFFHEAGTEVRWLWLFWPQASRQRERLLTNGWVAKSGPEADRPDDFWAGSDDAAAFPPDRAPWHYSPGPLNEEWWYGLRLKTPTESRWWLRLPRGMPEGTRLWFEDREMDINDLWPRLNLLPGDVACPNHFAGRDELRITLFVPFAAGHRPKNSRVKEKKEGQALSPDEPLCLMTSVSNVVSIQKAEYRDGAVRILLTDGDTVTVSHDLLPAEGK